MTAARGGRDPWLDNAKMALVTLVVVGHAWALLPDEGVAQRLYDFLYAWHMPAFVFVTGYLSRTFTYAPERLWQLVRIVAVPYVLFECALALFRVHVGGERLEDLFRDPHWPLWYLSALFFWRLLTPVFRPMRAGAVVAVAVSIAAGMWAGDTLDLARILGMLPFFVLGLKATPERLALLTRTPVRVAAVAVLGGIWWLSAYTDRVANTEFLYYRALYEELGVSDSQAALTRLGLLAVGVAGGLAFLALVPRIGGRFTRMGAATLVVYLFHGFVVKGAEYAGFPGWSAEHPALALALTTAGGVLLALALAAPPVARRLHHLVDPFGIAERRVEQAAELNLVPADSEVVADALARQPNAEARLAHR